MRVLLLYNPISGAGRSREAAEDLGRRIDDAGHTVELQTTRRDPDPAWLIEALAEIDVLVVCGGDGTVHGILEAAIAANCPIFQVPRGTENLFAREFGMTAEPRMLLDALAAHEVRRLDVATANEHRFLLMVSVGVDADVIHDLAARRTGAISHLSYIPPVLRQVMRWTRRRLRVTVDGTSVVTDETPGSLVVANCRQYARFLNPAADASMTDGLLDVVFFPATSRLGMIAWAIRCARGRQVQHPRAIHVRGRSILVEADEPFRYQMDGDRPPGDDSGTVASLRVEVQPGRLPVLLTPGPGAS